MEHQDVPRGGKAIAQKVKELYARGESDYAMPPIVVVDEGGHPIGRISDGDAVIFCCRRGEREVQLTRAFVDPTLDAFPRRLLRNLTFVIMTLYHERFSHLPIAFPPIRVTDTLSEVISRAGKPQLHVAESEKFAHITFFFNGGRNEPFPGEIDIKIPSPKGVPFEEMPGLSAEEVVTQTIRGLQSRYYSFVAVNIANGDVIGHLSDMPAKVTCAHIVDTQLGRLLDAAQSADYVVLVTADHGVLEVTRKPDGSPNVGHTDNPVPVVLIAPGLHASDTILRRGEVLSAIAPTVLDLLGLPRPREMDRASLLLRPFEAQRVLLVILDGWGIGRCDADNPIYLAETPVWDGLMRRYPTTTLRASGEAVGLKPEKMGNSEAGHMNMAAGRIVLQDDARVEAAMKDGSFYTNPAFLQAIEHARTHHTPLHLIGMLSRKSSHGTMDYPLALLRLAREQGLEEVYVHLILDGRSSDPGSAPAMLLEFESKMAEIGIGTIVTGVGRGIALDRDGNYRQKTRRAYEALVLGKGEAAPLA